MSYSFDRRVDRCVDRQIDKGVESEIDNSVAEAERLDSDSLAELSD
jgi:hypothetical protein